MKPKSSSKTRHSTAASAKGDRQSAVAKPSKTKPKTKAEKTAEKPDKPKGLNAYPIVGVGASAGGLEALEELFSKMPSDPGMGFVVITHQHPGHATLLPEILSRATSLPVIEAEEGMKVELNHVYIAPSGGYLDILNGRLLRIGASNPQAPHLPVDHFFRSLAQDQKERAISIILSGTGTDGTLGMAAVKAEYGMTMVQNVESSKYDGMPSSAIATGIVDFVLPPSDMPERLIAYAHGPYQAAPLKAEAREIEAESMGKILVLLRSRTGHDFSDYKSNTIRRRVERRLNIHSISKPEQYVRYLLANPHEIDILFKELLISVTNFFRDPEAYGSLFSSALPQLLESRPANSPFRVWVPGCATGEEAYSLAILIRESMEAAKQNLDVQIFGTDLDSEAIDNARQGIYPEGIAEDVSPERLVRFFDHKNNAYQIHKNIREMVVFAVQNVIKDPPFTKLDCIACRNLLIYLNADLQKKLLPVFHYALKPGGLLFLGSSETVGNFSDMFEVVDKKWKIFRRKECLEAKPKIVDFPIAKQHVPIKEMFPAVRRKESTDKLSLSSLVDHLLVESFAPACVVVNNRGDVAYIHGHIGAYLEPAPGQPRLNVHEMARAGLKIELASALRLAITQKDVAKRTALNVKIEGEKRQVDLVVRPIHEPVHLDGLFLISFEPREVLAEASEIPQESPGKVDAEMTAALELELENAKESLRTTIEELETSNEELKSTNEELQSTNEELQSSNEELETSKEEMQSLNEELTTVNTELNTKIDDLSQVNDDMQNLLNSTKIATIFLDTELRIKRYTEPAIDLVKLIESDVGRPLTDLAFNLNYETLVDDSREVLRTLAYKEVEVQSSTGQWYLMRIMPYRTSVNVIEGLVMTFVDIDPLKKTEQKLAEATARLAADLKAMTRLYQVGTQFLSEGGTPRVMNEVLEAAISIGNADMGHLDRFNRTSSKLETIEQRGFSPAALDLWESANLADGRFGKSLKKGERIVVENLRDDKLLAHTPLQEVLSEAGVQSLIFIPLIRNEDEVVGMICLLYKRQYLPESHVLQLLELLERQAAQIIEKA